MSRHALSLSRSLVVFALAVTATGGAALAVSACGETGGGDPAEKKKPTPGQEPLRNMAPRTPAEQAAAVTDAIPEVEPNDLPEQATRLTWSGRSARASGTLAGGSADIDVVYVPPSPGASTVGVTLTPLGDADLLLGVVARKDTTPVWYDAALAGQTEHLPNLALGSDGTWIYITGRGEQEIAWQLDLEAVTEGGAVEAEPNDTERLAHTLALGTVTTAWINRAGDRDVFRIPPEPPGAGAGATTVTISPPGAGRVLDVTLRDDKQVIWHTTVQDNQPATFPGLRPNATGYSLTVELIGDLDKPRLYSIALDRTRSSSPVELEPNDDPVSAQEIDPTLGPLRASIGQRGDRDHYRAVFAAPVSADVPHVLSVHVEPADPRLDLAANVSLVESGIAATLSTAPAGEPEILCNVALSGSETVEVAVMTATEPAADVTLPLDYTLHVTLRPAVGEEIEPNDKHTIANPIEIATPIAGFIHPATDRDVYAFDVPDIAHDPRALATTTLSVAEGYKANLAIELYDAQFLAVSTGDRTGFGEAETLVAQLPAGRYFAVVRSNGLASCSKPYRLRVDLDRNYLERAAGTAAQPQLPHTDGQGEGVGLTPPGPGTGTATTTGNGTGPGTTTGTSGTTGADQPASGDPAGTDDDGALPPDRIDDDGLGFE